MIGSGRVQSARIATTPRARSRSATGARFSTVSSLTLHVRHQAAETSTKTVFCSTTSRCSAALIEGPPQSGVGIRRQWRRWAPPGHGVPGSAPRWPPARWRQFRRPGRRRMKAECTRGQGGQKRQAPRRKSAPRRPASSARTESNQAAVPSSASASTRRSSPSTVLAAEPTPPDRGRCDG